MSRVRKLLIVGLVLAIGMGLAWPFRKTDRSVDQSDPVESRPLLAYDSFAAAASDHPTAPHDAPPRHIAAKMASTVDTTITPTGEPGQASFDLANHPALANQPTSAASQPVTPTDRLTRGRQATSNLKKPTSRPAYAIAEETQSEAGGLREIVHIVRNTDTLEKLAKRYLGDAGRALEIFDLNREKLSNPHLLPIGAKLRIPVLAKQELD